MVRVDQDLVLARAQQRDALVEVVERDREVPRIAARWLQPETRVPEDPCRHQGEVLEPDERWLLCQFVEGDVTHREHRNPVGAVGVVMAGSVGAQELDVQLTASHDDNLVVGEGVSLAEQWSQNSQHGVGKADEATIAQLGQGSVQGAGAEPDASVFQDVGRDPVTMLRAFSEREQDQGARLSEPGQALPVAALLHHTMHRLTY